MKFKQTVKAGIFLLSAVALATGCNNAKNGSNTATSSSSVAGPTEEPLGRCYVAVIKRDTIQLMISEIEGNHVRGSLIYNFFEKDRSKGTFTGDYTNGILLANYVFNSEGTVSERPVIFKKVPDGFLEGFGETRRTDDKEVFADTAAIEFGDSYTLRQTADCLPL